MHRKLKEMGAGGERADRDRCCSDPALLFLLTTALVRVLEIFGDIINPIHLHHISASFTTKWILLLAIFGYYWQLKAIQLPSFVGSIHF